MWGVLFILLAGILPSAVYLMMNFEVRTKLQWILLSISLSVFTQFTISALIMFFLGFSPWAFLLVLIGFNVFAIWTWLRSGMKVEFKESTFEIDSFLGFASLAFAIFAYRILSDIQFGVDWVGFAVIASEYTMVEGGIISMDMTWWYSPAFPSLVAHVGFLTQQGLDIATFDVGTAGMIGLICGLTAAFDERKKSLYALIAMMLGVAIFAKFFDSGYPTIASLLPLSLALFLMFKQKSSLMMKFILLIASAFIHPSGFIYLLTFYVVEMVIVEDNTYKTNQPNKSLLIGGGVTLLFLLSELLLRNLDLSTGHWIDKEYGWQGGKPFLIFNGVLFATALYCYLFESKNKEIRLFSIWFIGLYCLSFVQYFGPETPLETLHLLSQILYSMSLHAFQIPLLGIVALSLKFDSHLQKKSVKALVLTIMLFLPTFLVFQIIPHEQNHAVQSSDILLFDKYIDEYDSIFSENAPWGYTWFEHNSSFVAKPTVGVVQSDLTLHSKAYTAILYDNVSGIIDLGIQAAISSPMGSLQWILSSSNFWEEIDHIDGSRIWEFRAAGNARQFDVEPIHSEQCIGCESRDDIWSSKHTLSYRHGFSPTIEFVEEGKGASLEFRNVVDDASIICLSYITHGSIGGIKISSEQSEYVLKSSAGYHRLCFDEVQADSFSIIWEHDESSFFFNPTGISGRSKHIFDVTGISFLAIETN